MTKGNSLRNRIGRARRGSVMLVTALTIPMAAGFAGLGVDVGIWETNKRALQTAADAAAVTGAIEKSRGTASEAMRQAALRDAGRNGFALADGSTAYVYNPPISGSYAGNAQAVEVRLTRPERPLLASLVFNAPVTLGVRSVAMMQQGGGGTPCVLALDPTAPSAAKFWGSASLDLVDCMIASNSTSSTSIDIGGNAQLTAASLWAAGEVSIGGSADVTLGTPAREHAATVADPFASVVVPAFSGCGGGTGKSYGKGKHTLSPGVYCDGLSFGSQADITLNPGTYIINRGDLSVHGQAKIRCNCVNATDGVTFIFTSSTLTSQIGTVNKINGGADIDLRAPSGANDPLRGIVFMQDRRAPTGGLNRFNGGSSMTIKGAIYFPAQKVDWRGNSGLSDCVEIVAREVEFSGNSRLEIAGCPALGVTTAQTMSVARVIE